VIRMVLCLGLSVLAVVMGLWTALLQSHNYERGLALNDLKERCSMIEAINGDQAAQILSSDSAPLPPEPKPATRSAPAPAPSAKDVASIAKLAPPAARSRGGAP